MCHALLPIACWIGLRTVLVAAIVLTSALIFGVAGSVRRLGDRSAPDPDERPAHRLSVKVLPLKLLMIVALVIIGATIIQNVTGALRQIVDEVPAQAATPQR